jgi:hypothetical protein
MAAHRKVDFYGLPRPVQERFAAATRRSAPPAPLLYASAPRTVPWAYLAASALLIAVAVFVLRLGWGDVSSPLALHGVKMLALDVALLGAASYCVVHALGILRALDALPWRAGKYLFPGVVVDASGPMLDVWSVSDAEVIERLPGPSAGLSLKMRDGSRVVVPAANSEQAAKADAALGSVRNDLAKAIAEEDPQLLAELNPLHDRAMSSPVGPTASMKRVLVVSKQFDWVIAAIAGVLLGLGLGNVRNDMSDDAMMRAIGPSGSVAAYQAYLAQGGRHSDDVRDLLLPRAQLREAEADGSIEAIQAFADAHPNSKIDADIQATLRKAMLVALDTARKAGTVGAIDDLAKKYPNHTIDPEIKAARHGYFAQAFDAWKKKASPDAATSAFMERLLGWSEAQGPGAPPVEIRFQARPSKSLDDADKSIRKSGHYPATDALPSKYMTTDAMRPREQRVAAALVQAFNEDFPPDILSMKAGDPLDPDATAPTATPVLVIDYAPEWSRANNLIEHFPTVIAGFVFNFEGLFTLPDTAAGSTGAPLKINARSWKAAEIWRIKTNTMPREEYEQKAYDMAIDMAFDILQKKLTDTLL